MKLKLISCSIFKPKVDKWIKRTTHSIEVIYNDLSLHVTPKELRQILQDEIDSTPEHFDFIMLLYGICGNATSSLVSRHIPLIIPRAHDCCTIFLGSKERFQEKFSGDPSSEWTTSSFIDQGDNNLIKTDMDHMRLFGMDLKDFIREHGEENTKYVLDQLRPPHSTSPFYFISPNLKEDQPHLSLLQERAASLGREVEIIQGSLRIIKNLLLGNWDNDTFLRLNPQEPIIPLYDFDKVFKGSLSVK